MKKSKLFLVILCISFIFFSTDNEALASNKKYDINKSFSVDTLLKNTEVDLRLNYGFFIHHHNEMTAYPKQFPMFELSLQKQSSGEQSWHSHLNYPIIGMAAFYSDLGNIDIIGNAYALYPFINFPFNKSKTNTLGLRFGVGVGYLTEKFHPTENFRNTSIGSHINAAISISFEYKHQISERFKVAAFAGLTHFSNGCSRTPNHGINIINAGLSTSYSINYKSQDISYKPDIDNINYKGFHPQYYIGMSFGVKRISYDPKDNFGVYDLEFYVMDRIGEVSKVGLGLDFTYNRCDYISVANYYGTNQEYKFLDLLKPGIGFAYELLMGDLSFLLSIGVHTYRYTSNVLCYQKLGAKLNFSRHIYGKIALNTHFGKADFIGFGLGIEL